MILEDYLNTIDHSRAKRAEFAQFILNHPESLPDLFEVCEKIDDEISCRASWGLEFLCKKNLNAILPHLDRLIRLAPNVYQHPAVRPIARIFEYLTEAYYKKKAEDVRLALTAQHREKMTEICFDWLITDQKVAPKAYSMTSLYLLGTEFDWVHPELKITLENNYHDNSAAYQARSRMILQKIKV